MPNHCSNMLMTTNPELIKILRKCDSSADEDFIEASMPTPEPLKSIITGSRPAPDGTTVNRWREGLSGECIPVTDAEAAQLVVDYGHTDWYDWNIANRGTKWGSYSTVYDFPNESIAVVHFDTAWAPPEAWLRHIIGQYPAGMAQLAYAEGGSAYFGKVVYVDGVLIEDEASSDFWLDDVDWDKIEDSIDALTPACRTHIVSNGLHTGG